MTEVNLRIVECEEKKNDWFKSKTRTILVKIRLYSDTDVYRSILIEELNLSKYNLLLRSNEIQ